MVQGLVSDEDIQKATTRLQKVLPDGFLRSYFGKEHLDKLKRGQLLKGYMRWVRSEQAYGSSSGCAVGLE